MLRIEDPHAQSARWIFVLNNYTADDETYFSTLPSSYTVFGREVGKSGTPHLQGFIVFDKTKRFSAVKKIHSRCHWEVAHGTSEQAAVYAKKDGDYFESGRLPASQGRRNDLEAAITTLKSDGIAAVAREHTAVFIKYSRGLRDVSLFLQNSYKHESVRGIWIYGPPGTGKSHVARSLSDSLYIKAQNKWFDGYDGELNILLDDLDTAVLGHYLKIWADRWPCSGETKGGTVNLRHQRFIVTSNYAPEHFWGDDEPMCKAIERRFKVILKDSIEHEISDQFNCYLN